MPGTSRPPNSEAGAAEDLAGAGVDIDPHHLRPAHELEAVAPRESVELRAQIGEAAHSGDDSVLEIAPRHEAPRLPAAKGFVLLPLVRASVGESAGEDDAEGGDKGKDILHGGFLPGSVRVDRGGPLNRP